MPNQLTFAVLHEQRINYLALVLGTVEPEINLTSAENPDLSKVLSSKLGLGQNTALHASIPARKSAL